jgi:hypothetical protein
MQPAGTEVMMASMPIAWRALSSDTATSVEHTQVGMGCRCGSGFAVGDTHRTVDHDASSLIRQREAVEVCHPQMPAEPLRH